MNVLFVSDRLTEADAVKLALNSTAPNLKLDCVSAQDASERLKKRSPYDVVLVDWHLPENGAPSLIKTIRQLYERVVVVVVTLPTGRPISLEALRSGADDYIAQNDRFVAALPLLLQQAVERVRAAGALASPVRVLYGGDIEFAQRHLAGASSQLRLAVRPAGPNGQPLVPQFAAPGLPLPYDVLIVEHAFQEVDVFETLKEVRARRLDFPVVVVHKAGEEEVACEALRFGAADCVSKTESSFKTLPARLEQIVRHSRLSRDYTKLMRSDADLQSLIDNLPTGVMKVGWDGKILALNAAGWSMFDAGGTDQLIGASLYSRIVAEDREATRKAIKAVSDGQDQELEVAVMAPDGGVRLALHMRAVPLPAPLEGTPCMLASVHRVRQDLPQRALETEIDLQKFADHAGQEAESCTEHTDGQQQAQFEGPIATARQAEDPPAPRVQEVTDSYPIEEAVQAAEHSDGQIVSPEAETLTNRHTTAQQHEAGQPQRLAQVSADNSARPTVACSRTATCCTLPNGRLVEVSSELSAMLGYPSAQQLMEANLATDIFTNPDEFHHIWSKVQRSGSTAGAETFWNCKDGRLLTARIVACALSESERLDWVVEDITELRRLEDDVRRSRRLAAVGQLATSIARDSSEFLTAARNHSGQLVQLLRGNEAWRAHAETVASATAEVDSMIQQLAAFSRKQTRARQLVDLNVLINDMQSLVGRITGESLDLAIQTLPSRACISVDSEDMGHIIASLAITGRALLVMGGRLSIETRMHYLDHDHRSDLDLRPGSYVVLAVTATGCGINRELQESLRCEPAAGGGTPTAGADLARILELVKEHGGDFRVTSDPGRRTQFEIVLPSSPTLPAREALSSRAEVVGSAS